MFLGNISNKQKLICLHTVKRFHVLLYNVNNLI